jgi:ribosomal protein S18 acetylase RimI-like enzyme
MNAYLIEDQTTTLLQVNVASELERVQILDTLTSAFSSDPVARWIFPDPQQYRASFPLFAQAYGGRAFKHRTAFSLADYHAAALWLPPGANPDEEAMVSLFQQAAAKDTLPQLFSILEQMGTYHPTEPHWYLPLLGVKPDMQGRGLGSALLRHALQQCDHARVPAYLESSNPRNIPLYERHGFRVLGTIQSGNSPELIPMLRQSLGSDRNSSTH